MKDNRHHINLISLIVRVLDKFYIYGLYGLVLYPAIPAVAQMDSCLFMRNHRISPDEQGELRIEIDNVSFFKDNEWQKVTNGYTLPGLWIQPKATYNPLKNLHLEAGLHSLIYAGCTKYPNIIYQDMAVWKGDQYMSGTHILPYFRANLQLGNINVILGDIYGGANHHLPEPLFSQELNLSADPEMGMQTIVDINRLHLDLWANWQSFIFLNDHHQESFIFGLNTAYTPYASTSSDISNKLSIPLSFIAHHRGGEKIDSIYHKSVKTVLNGSIGLAWQSDIRDSWLKRWQIETHLLGYYQEAGTLYPKDKGWGIYSKIAMQTCCGIGAKIGYEHSHNFISLLSYPFYGTLSTRDNTGTYDNTDMLNIQIDWTKRFGKHYTFGIRGEAFTFFPHGGYSDGTIYIPEKISQNLSIGIFLKVNPSFVIGKLKED